MSWCSTGSNELMRSPKELPTEGAVAGADDDGPAGDDPAAPGTAEEARDLVPPPRYQGLRAVATAAAQRPRVSP